MFTSIKRFFCFLFFVSNYLHATVSAQGFEYVIFIKDKKQNSFSVENPAQFLSAKCLENRARFHIPVTELDLPVSDFYEAKLASFSLQKKYTIKWLNALVAHAETEVDSLLQTQDFVHHFIKIKIENGAQLRKQSKFETYSDTCVIDTNFFYGAAANQTQMIRVEALHNMGFKGEGVIITSLDNGFWGGNQNPYLKTVFDENRVLFTKNYVIDTLDVYKTGGHGLATWSCMAANIPNKLVGTSPNAKFILMVTEDDNSETVLEEYNWAAAAELAENKGSQVFSTSLGYTTFDSASAAFDHTYADLNGHTTVIAKAANRAASLGVIVVNAAGNEGAKSWHYISTPADADSCLAVGAVTGQRTIADFSSRGFSNTDQVKPNVCTQGVLAAVSSISGGQTRSNGTSFACPILAGGAACLRQAFPDSSNWAIMQAIQQSAHLFHHPNTDYGYGIPDFFSAYLILQGAIKIPFNQESTTHVFPNPFLNQLNIYRYNSFNEKMNLEVYNYLGQKVWAEEVCLIQNEYNLIPVQLPESLAPGEYFIRLKIGNQIEKYKILKK